ncbi:multidrug MFS transporter [Arthrobacter sp. RIT-PI-e]|uniref:DHA2 family efflux MFS transporter permease subunit n=1 Tax=Arthrobacter sp. RIT-PI-e TaxID=1681197 RepID=UPI000675E27B|nr:DHA2 family efflux MFS transporter permease subunit [Arthrobacter sp. RIT-PI-e]KNC18365.1 multidrug MFS transporter [Arthrobacter sp. RIT-PI-e]
MPSKAPRSTPAQHTDQDIRPWPALWSLVIGFFMILVDSTIVSVATPAIMEGLGAGIDSVIWVTSAYLLAYAVPLLMAGRLGDRFGPKRIYLIGLVVFTVSSAWCGFAGSVDALILARVLQGLGAALMTPQTMSVITRIFPPERRGAAMGLWGSVAGIATLVGPVVGGLLVDSAGWEWIFFINVPVGVVGFVLAARLVPTLPTTSRRFDFLGVFLSAAGLFCLVFGIQEGETYDWGTIAGPLSVWSLIIGGIVLLFAFVLWQRFNRGEPLVPLRLFGDRNFSLANTSITAMGFTITTMTLPLMLYAQTVRGLSPTQAALLLTPMAVISGVLAPFVGKYVQRGNPKYIAIAGFAGMSAALFWLGSILTPDVPIWQLLLPIALLGLSSAGIWSPVSLTATRNLSPSLAGAGSGVYNTTRQMGAVLGSAAIAAIMQARLTTNLVGADGVSTTPGTALPDEALAGYALSMGQALYLPATVVIIGFGAALFFAKPQHTTAWADDAGATGHSPAGGSAAEPALDDAPSPGSAQQVQQPR